MEEHTNRFGEFSQMGRHLDGKIDGLGARLDGKIEALARSVDAKIDTFRAEMTNYFRWTIGIMLTLAGLFAAFGRR